MAAPKMPVPASRCTYPPGCTRMTLSASGRCHHHPLDLSPDLASLGSPPVRLGGPPPRAVEPPTAPTLVSTQPVDERAPLVPRPYQEEGVASVMEELRRADRVQLRAPCGMGKTLMSQMVVREHYEEVPGNGIYLVVTDGIDLTKQLRGDYSSDGLLDECEPRFFSVHHGSGDLEEARRRRRGADVEEADVEAITEFLAAPAVGPKVVFTTYDSAHKVAGAQRRLGDAGQADVTLLDEAHRLGGEFPGSMNRPASKGGSRLPVGADDEALPRLPRVFFDAADGSLQSRSRVFMSASPRSQSEGDRYRSSLVMNRDQILRLCAAEDAGEDIGTFRLFHTQAEVFGRPVTGWTPRDAVQKGALVPMEILHTPLGVPESSVHLDRSTRVDAGGRASVQGALSLASWTATAATLTALADGEGHNVLTFSRLIAEAEGVRDGWSQVAAALAGPAAPSPERARMILDDPGSDPTSRRRARLVLLGTHANVVAASSKSTPEGRRQAMDHFDRQTLGDQGCDCGRPGNWCACARVVANVDLFGQGVSINSVDTTVLASPDKGTDIGITQATGRAMRRWPSGGKTKGRVVVPSVHMETPTGRRMVDARTTTSLLYGLSRLHRDAIGSGMGNSQMEGRRGIPLRTLDGVSDLEATLDSLLPGVGSSAVLSRSWDAVQLSARKHYEDHHPGQRWKDLGPDEQHATTTRYARAFAGDGVEQRIVAQTLPDRYQVDASRRAMILLQRRVNGYDRRNLTPEERTVCRGMGWLDASDNLPSRPPRASTDRLFRRMGANAVRRVVDGLMAEVAAR